ncbi:MAG: hypothetical protein DRN49_00130 [Thaumarchaeota archaeon]|nr:MAG: hypothetical protein DRN49_00130 [Nitrososphaerota archaeon]
MGSGKLCQLMKEECYGEMPFPPLPEQEKSLRFFLTADKRLKVERKRRGKANRNKKEALMDLLLTSKIRVKSGWK